MKSCTQDRCGQGRFPCPCSVDCESDDSASLLADYATSAVEVLIGISAAIVVVCAAGALIWGML